MRAIIIGAGRGSRLGRHTDEVPKTLVPVAGKPMLDWVLDALVAAGFERDQVVFISGYREQVVRERYPEFEYVRNEAWETNNILLSLLCARDYLGDGFVSTYADIVYTPEIAAAVTRNPADLVLGCDTAWRRRYAARSQHPESDAEKLRAEGSRVVEISRHIPSDAAQGEFIGVMKASTRGAAQLLQHFDAAQAEFATEPSFREGRSFQKAYLIDLLQWMLERGVAMQCEDTPGGYMEIDTLEDLEHAAEWWRTRPR